MTEHVLVGGLSCPLYDTEAKLTYPPGVTVVRLSYPVDEINGRAHRFGRAKFNEGERKGIAVAKGFVAMGQ